MINVSIIKKIMPQFIFILLSTSICHAAPVISTLNGTFSHGQSVTITGSGFGTKSVAAPVVWDNCSGTKITDKWSGAWPDSGTTAYQMHYTTPIRSVGLPHSHITRYMAGAHGDSAGANDGYDVLVWKNLYVSFPMTVYLSAYFRCDPNWVFNASDNNFKQFQLSTTGSPYGSGGFWYMEHTGQGNTAANYDGGWHINDSSGGPGSSYWWNGLSNPFTGWVKQEMELRIANDSSGYIKLWENGQLRVNFTGKTDNFAGTLRNVSIGGYYRRYGEPNNVRYFADLYFDTTAQRVIIGNASTLASSTSLREVQIPLSWSDSSITVSINQGAFPDGATAHLFVVDANGNSSPGKQITFAASGGVSPLPLDTIAPSVSISSPIAGATVSGIQTVAVSASDNTGVTKVELYVDGALASYLTGSPYNFSWNTSSVANGSHTIIAKAYDAANNSTASNGVTLSVSNAVVDSTAPTITISSPTSGATITGKTTVTATASDNVGVTKVDFYMDSTTSTAVASLSATPFTFTLDPSTLANGSHTLFAVAFDVAGNRGQSSIAVTVSIPVSSTLTKIMRSECATPPSGTVFCEDFEGPNPKANFNDYDGNPDTENLIVNDSGPAVDASNMAIRLRVPAGKGGVSDLVKVLPASYDKLYARWYFKYEPGFNFSALNHGGGLAAGSRNYIGASGNRPNGDDFAYFNVQYQENTVVPYAYSYYRGMYQDCRIPGSCYGDSLPCVYDKGALYCKKSQDIPTVTLPIMVAGQWYCYEQMVDMGTPSTTGSDATGRITQWLDGNMIGDNTNLWFRTISSLKLQNLWLSLYHHDGTHSVAGELIDNVVVSTQRIGCGGPLPVSVPTGVQIKQVIP